MEMDFLGTERAFEEYAVKREKQKEESKLSERLPKAFAAKVPPSRSDVFVNPEEIENIRKINIAQEKITNMLSKEQKEWMEKLTPATSTYFMLGLEKANMHVASLTDGADYDKKHKLTNEEKEEMQDIKVKVDRLLKENGGKELPYDFVKEERLTERQKTFFGVLCLTDTVRKLEAECLNLKLYSTKLRFKNQEQSGYNAVELFVEKNHKTLNTPKTDGKESNLEIIQLTENERIMEMKQQCEELADMIGINFSLIVRL